MGVADLVRTLRRAFTRAIASIDPAARVREAIAGRGFARVLAVGKAAPSMLAGALGPELRSALLVVPEGTRVTWVDPHTEVLFADHPLPTARSVAAAERALAFAAKGSMLALISGGASSLLCAPQEGLSLERQRALVRALLAAGVPISDVNVVRRHLSRVKGGRLGVACGGEVLTLIASDVLKGAPWDVGSGPTVPDPTTADDARAVIARLGPEWADLAPTESVAPTDPRARALEHRIVLSPADLLDAAKVALEAEEYRVYTLPSAERDVGELAAAYAGLAQTLSPGDALVRVAEPTVEVTVPDPGRGGRSTHLAAMASTRLPADVALLCGASDGVDGASDSAGAIGIGAAVRGMDVRGALARFDTATLHANAGTLLDLGGPTGVNLCDVHVLARAR